jgi:hypothetical protein
LGARGPFEAIPRLLKLADFPKYTLMSIGATRYTDFGEHVYLEASDESIVVAYDSRLCSTTDVEQFLVDGVDQEEGLSILRQKVVSQFDKTSG